MPAIRKQTDDSHLFQIEKKAKTATHVRASELQRDRASKTKGIADENRPVKKQKKVADESAIDPVIKGQTEAIFEELDRLIESMPRAKRSKSRSRSKTPKRKTSRTTTKKTSTKRRTTTKKVAGPIAKHLMGYLNPFAHADGVQIPDGAVPASLPWFHRNVFQVTAPYHGSSDPGEISPDGTAHIMLYPGLNGGVAYAINEPNNQNEDMKYIDYSTEKRFWGTLTNTASGAQDGIFNSRPASEENGDFDRPASSPVGKLQIGNGIVKWRLVSQGMKVTLLNPDANNDGWFEAVRVHYKPDLQQWQLNGDMVVDASDRAKFIVNTIGGMGLQLHPRDLIIDDQENRNWAENKTYVCDRLSNIHKYRFNLAQFKGVNDFRENRRWYETHKILGDEIGYSNGNTPEYPPASYSGSDFAYQLQSGEDDAYGFFRDYVDEDHDMIFIRVHPGSGLSNEGAQVTGAQLLCEHVCNQEAVYETDYEHHKLMRDAPVDKAATARATSVKQEEADVIPMVG